MIHLWLLSVPIVSQSLFKWLETLFVQHASSAQQILTGAVVFLGSGKLRSAPEFGDNGQLSQYALWRISYCICLVRNRVDAELAAAPFGSL
jgi:hypothetical protein